MNNAKSKKLNEQIDSQQLLNELMPLMSDYFIGAIQLSKSDISYKMPNGQTFKIFIKEQKLFHA